MTYRRCFALALVLSGVACGSGGGAGEPIDIGSQDPDYNEQAPPNSYGAPADGYQDAPVNGTQQPEYNEGAPPGGGVQVPGGGGSTPIQASCEHICDGFIAGQCDVDGSRDVCISECTTEFVSEYGVCADELLDVFVCIVDLPQFACVEGDLELEQYVQECPSESAVFSDCARANPEPEPEPEPEPTNECTPEAGCFCGEDACATCLCFFADAATCAVECGT